MNKVTLYQVTKSDHLVSANHLELSQYSYNDITPIRDGGGEFIVDQKIKHINIPIQKYVFSQKDWKGNVEERVVYAAFDNQLLELIQCERNKFRDLNDDLICKVAEISDLKADADYLENWCLKLKAENDKVRKMSFWERLVFLFKGFKGFKGLE